MARLVVVDCARIADWDSLHDVFAEAFGFPAYYGRNSSAWIDCMTYLDGGDTAVKVYPGEVVTVHLEGAQTLKNRAPDLLADIFEMSAFVNYRRTEMGEPPILCLSAEICA